MKHVLKQGTGYKTAPLQFLPTKYSQMVMPLTSTAFTKGMDENPYNSNINLIENSINKERWSGGVLQIHQNSLQLSPVVLMIHWSFSRKLRDNFSSLQELSKKKKMYWHLLIFAKRWQSIPSYKRNTILKNKHVHNVYQCGHTHKEKQVLSSINSLKLRTQFPQ